MKISALILAYLTENGRVRITGFGDFYLENAAAVLSSGNKILLPPAKKITWSPDYHAEGDDFEKYVAHARNSSLQEAADEIKVQVTYWKNKLNEAENFEVEDLGAFKFSLDEVQFEGSRIQHEMSDFYGLEEINLTDLKKKKGRNAESRASFRIGKVLIWTLVLGIPAVALAYFGITQPENVFGKKSFDLADLKISSGEKTTPPVTADSTHMSVKDSLEYIVPDSAATATETAVGSNNK